MWSKKRLLPGIAVLALFAAQENALAQAAGEAKPPIVDTAAVELAPVTRQREFVGSVVAAQQVALMPRVEGFLDKVNFVEGSFIKADSVAYEIEKDTYQASVDGAKATLQSAQAGEKGAQANLNQADIVLKRQVELVKTNAVAQSAVDQAQATRDSAAATLQQATAQIALSQAQLDTAELNLSFTDIKSPISGRIGKTAVTEGNLVSPSTGVLATVVQVDPIRVAFSISDREYLEVIKTLNPDNSGIVADERKFRPSLTLSDGTVYDQPGKIAFLDNTVDPSTGTIAVYAEFPNPKMQLVPGQYVTVTVESGQPVQLPVVPAAAILQDQEGPYVFVLADGNRAEIRRVTLGQRVGTDWAIQSGLASGEVIIVSGIQRVQAGIVVSPTPAKTGN